MLSRTENSTTEIEIKFLDINPEEIKLKLKRLNAKKVSDEILEEWIYKDPRWLPFKGRIRIRKEGSKTLLSYKETTKKTSEGNLEIEFHVDNHDAAKAFVDKLNIPLVRHQQKRRIHYELDSIAIDIDFWPLIPPMIEIEGETLEKIKAVAEKLGLKQETAVDALQIHQETYGIDLNKVKEMTFTKEQLRDLKS